MVFPLLPLYNKSAVLSLSPSVCFKTSDVPSGAGCCAVQRSNGPPIGYADSFQTGSRWAGPAGEIQGEKMGICKIGLDKRALSPMVRACLNGGNRPGGTGFCAAGKQFGPRDPGGFQLTRFKQAPGRQGGIGLSISPAHIFITPDRGARCVHGFSVGAARPFGFWVRECAQAKHDRHSAGLAHMRAR